MLDTSAQKMRRSGQNTYFVCQHVHQLRLSVGTAVGQSSLEVIPDALVRVQFGGVRRERHQVQPGSACEKFPNRFAVMDGAVVQQRCHGRGAAVQVGFGQHAGGATLPIVCGCGWSGAHDGGMGCVRCEAGR